MKISFKYQTYITSYEIAQDFLTPAQDFVRPGQLVRRRKFKLPHHMMKDRLKKNVCDN